MSSAVEVGCIVATLGLILVIIQKWRYRRRGEELKRQHHRESESAATMIAGLRSELSKRAEEIDRLASTQQENVRAFATLTATNDQLAKDLKEVTATLAFKNEESVASAAQIAQLESKLAEEATRLAALLHPKPHVPRPRSPFEIQCTDEWLLTKLLPEALRYCEEFFARRLVEMAPENTNVHLINDPGGDIVTCIVARPDGSVAADARRWFTGVDGEHNHLLSLKDEAKVFAVKIHLATGHLEFLNVSQCADLARDFVHLLATGGASMLRILSSMSLSIKMDSLGRKSDHIILLLDSAQVGRLNGIFVGAGEQYRKDAIDQTRIMPLRQELLELEWELLAELRGRLATAPDVREFQIKWGQMKRSSREDFYNVHFRGGIGKIRLAIEAFLIDMILAQDTDSRDHFFAYTVAQQANELAKINKVFGAQLLVVKDNDRVQEARALHRVCQQFQVLLEHLVPPSPDNGVAAAA